MEITLEQYDDIQLYLDGKMEPAPANAFLQELNTNAALKDAFEFERSLRSNLESIAETREILALTRQHDEQASDPAQTDDPANRAFIRDIIRKSAEEWKEGRPAIAAPGSAAPTGSAAPPAKVVPFRRWTAVAVAASLLIAVAGIVFFQHNGHHTADPAELFAAFFKKDTIPNEKYPMLAQAFTGYSNNNYKTLQNYDLENLPTLKGGDDQRQKLLELGYYYRGISFLATDEPARAMPDLQWVIDHAQTEDLVWKAQWYEALALVKSSHIPAAMALLRSVSSNPKAEGYNRQATDLLHQLSKNSP
jgi:hypothetical protein